MGSLHWFGRVHTWVTYIHTYIALPPPSPRQVIHVPVALDETKYEGSYLYISPHDNITQMLLVMVNNKARKGMGFFSLPGYFCLHKFISIGWQIKHIYFAQYGKRPLSLLSRIGYYSCGTFFLSLSSLYAKQTEMGIKYLPQILLYPLFFLFSRLPVR